MSVVIEDRVETRNGIAFAGVDDFACRARWDDNPSNWPPRLKPRRMRNPNALKYWRQQVPLARRVNAALGTPTDLTGLLAVSFGAYSAGAIAA